MSTTPPLVRVYNKSPQQTFIHDPYRAAPSSFVEVPPDVAENWYRLFPGVVVEAGVAQKELGGVTAELVAERAKVAALEAALEALKNATGNRVEIGKALVSVDAELAKLKAPAGAKPKKPDNPPVGV